MFCFQVLENTPKDLTILKSLLYLMSTLCFTVILLLLVKKISICYNKPNIYGWLMEANKE